MVIVMDEYGKISKVRNNYSFVNGKINILVFVDLLKSCIGSQSNKRLLNSDGSLVNTDRLRENICSKEQSYKHGLIY